MMNITRHSNNLLSSWWWTVDRLTLAVVATLMLIGIVMVSTASPAVAEHIGLDGFYFVRRQLVFLTVSVGVIFGISLLSPVVIRRIALFGYMIGIILLMLVLVAGVETKGARRWINVIGFSLQPSEFMKPFFVVLTAWFLAQKGTIRQMKSYQLIIGSYLLLAGLLILQPDFGMTVTISSIWGVQLFLGGLPMIWVIIALCLAPIAVLVAYTLLPHVAQRINSFLDPSEQGYQVAKSLEAFRSGGFFGKGPGEGTVKQHLPDSHTDFIFAVTGEELGLFVSLIIVALFAFLVIRNYMRAFAESDLFTMYAVVGLATEIGLQACINMSVTLNLIPNKGMTLPFISYGGSSLLAMSVAMGMLLGLTRKRYGQRVMNRPMVG
jgi:cell division protein FtsW